jgi:hypothetical protein
MIRYAAIKFEGRERMVWSGTDQEDEEGVAFSIRPEPGYKSLEEMIPLLRDVDKAWLLPHPAGPPRFWILDLDKLREAFPDLRSKEWLTGRVHLDAKFHDMAHTFVLRPCTQQLKPENFRIQPNIDERALLSFYDQLVLNAHPTRTAFWPVLSGYVCKVGTFRQWIIVIFQHTGDAGHITVSRVGEFPPDIIGAKEIHEHNVDLVRSQIEKHYNLRPNDAVLLLTNSRSIDRELQTMLRRHEHAMGLVVMKIFLSHKGADKSFVRDFKDTLQLLGFDPWLDEDVPAGTKLERGIRKGLKDSCAAVFFITPNFIDEGYLASEIDYAIEEAREKPDFAIVTLVFEKDGKTARVPDLLRRFWWKTPRTDLEALREILKAIPVKPGPVYWKG